jgi:hypothetical protein
VLAFADALERGRPAMRMRSWRMDPLPGGGLRFSGDMLAVLR